MKLLARPPQNIFILTYTPFMADETSTEVTTESAKQSILEAIQESANYIKQNNPSQAPERLKDLAEALAWLKSGAQPH